MRQSTTQLKPGPTSAGTPATARRYFPVWLIAAFLGLATLALYWPALHCNFINYDDNVYVTSNIHVQKGLTLQNLKWAFVHPVSDNWHPLTMLSHMMDCQLFGLKPWGHHLTSVLLHALNTVLVFLLLHGLTGSRWRSALVAALFGWHPLHVESVAWVAERKDVLSGFFGLLTLIFYGRYARRRSGSQGREPNGKAAQAFGFRFLIPDYVLALFFFALGLMCKPMLVTWPFVMLLLDYWPLGRFEFAIPTFRFSIVWQLVREKIPFFALSALSSVVTYEVQQRGGAMASGENLPLAARGANALISYCRYIGKLLWPKDMAVFYPYPRHWPLAEVLVAGGLLLGISILLFMGRRRYPFMLIGWSWFVGTLVPVIGLVQVGQQAMADRYSYLPSVGLFIIVTWGVYELTLRWPYQATALSAISSATLVACFVLTRQQLSDWKNSETLFRHALAVTENNYGAHNNLGAAFDEKGQFTEAIRQFQAAIRLKPDYAEAYNNLGNAQFKLGQLDRAIRQFQEAIRLKPNYADAHYNLGVAIGREGQIEQEISQLQEAIRLKPDFAKAYVNLGIVLETKGQLDQAIGQFQEAIRRNPDFAEAHNNLGVALGKEGQTDQAIRQFQEAIRMSPDFVKAHLNLGSALFNQGQFDEAVGQFQEALRLNPDLTEAHNNLGFVLFKQGQLDEAIRQFQEAIRLKPDYAEAHNNLGDVLFCQGRLDAAIRQLREAIRLKPDYAQAHNTIGIALFNQGHLDEAIRQFQEAIRLKPDYAEAHNNLGGALGREGRTDEAIREFREAVRLKPNYLDARNNLKRALSLKNIPRGR